MVIQQHKARIKNFKVVRARLPFSIGTVNKPASILHVHLTEPAFSEMEQVNLNVSATLDIVALRVNSTWFLVSFQTRLDYARTEAFVKCNIITFFLNSKVLMSTQKKNTHIEPLRRPG